MMARAFCRPARRACPATFLLVFAGLISSPVALAHLFLTQQSLDDALASIGEWHAGIPAAGHERGDPEAWFRVGEAGWALADLMNEEVRVHGSGQQALLTEAIERARDYGVSIAWSDDHQRFFYDGDAYRRYLDAAAGGIFAADSRYRLIELNFYLASADSVAALQARAAEKRDFLDDYPAFVAVARVRMFLGIDYRDLYRLCSGNGDTDCGQHYGKLAVQAFRQVAEAYADSDNGEVARRLLQRTSDEIAEKQ